MLDCRFIQFEILLHTSIGQNRFGLEEWLEHLRLPFTGPMLSFQTENVQNYGRMELMWKRSSTKFSLIFIRMVANVWVVYFEQFKCVVVFVFHCFPWFLTSSACKESAERWIEYIENLSEEDLEGSFSYTTSSGSSHTDCRADIMAHVINHSTHHRGQVSAAFVRILPDAPHVVLDLPVMLREKL